MKHKLVSIEEGTLKGLTEGGVTRFLGVPYARPPLGELRFKAPLPCEPWTGVRDATVQGPSAPQAMIPEIPGLDIASIVGHGWRRGDDFLQANVWLPEGDATGLPVMVFIHGGSFVAGNNDAPVLDGTAFARSGVVIVSINYRLGIEGFVAIPGVPTNLGLRDQIAALRWVRANIRSFGGDPDNITLFGESAGAISIACLLASPLTEGLFRRAILQSGHGSMIRSIPVAQRLARKLAKMAGVTPDVKGFARLAPEQWLPHLTKVQLPTTRLDLREADGREPSFGLTRFLPVHGDDVLPVPPLAALEAGAARNVDLLIGANSEEMNLFMGAANVREEVGWLTSWLITRTKEPNAFSVLRAYAAGKRQRPGDVLADALNDLVFRLPARVFAARHKGRTHFYEFDWQSPAFDGMVGAAHAVELPFVFNSLACGTGPDGFLGTNPPQELADRIHGLWVSFAVTGELSWPEFDDETRHVFSLKAEVARPEPKLPAAAYWP